MVHRRRFLQGAATLWAVPSLAAVPLLSARALAQDGAKLQDSYPSHDPGLAREMVGVSHGNLARVKELLSLDPAFSRAAWDWGFGDWETALGAASHVGNREIALLLMENGARPDIFTFAMLGHLDAVKAFVAAQPGIQKLHGPHGLTLLHHAKKGGESAAAVAAWLEELGDADTGYTNLPLEADPSAYVSFYDPAGSGGVPWKVGPAKNGGLEISRQPDGSSRVLYHQGGHEFHPAGNSSARIRFEVSNGIATSISITEGGRRLVALRRAE
jgi:hypothetical protein